MIFILGDELHSQGELGLSWPPTLEQSQPAVCHKTPRTLVTMTLEHESSQLQRYVWHIPEPRGLNAQSPRKTAEPTGGWSQDMQTTSWGCWAEVRQEAFLSISGSPTFRVPSLVIPQDQDSNLEKPRIGASDFFSATSGHSESGHLGWGLRTIFWKASRWLQFSI